MNRRVLVIALDGATLDLIEPWARENRLPHLRALLESGASARLESTLPPITGAAWTSFQTGVQPGRHGHFDWLTRDERSYKLVPISARSIPQETLWEYLSRYGKRVGVMGVPVSYPARPVNGFLLTDLLTPSDENYASPPELKDEIERAVGSYPVMPEHWKGRYVARRWLGHLKANIERRLQIARYLMRTRPWDFFMLHIMETDSVQHQMWHLLDNIKRPRYHGGWVRGNPILEVYQHADAAVGELRRELSEQDTLLVISDHGFGPLYYNIYLNCWLYQEGYLKLKSDLATRLKWLCWKTGLTPANLYVWLDRLGVLGWGSQLRHAAMHELFGRFFLSMQNIDWLKTRAYSHGNVGQIYLNLRGREPQGCVAPESANSLIEEIAAKLKELRNPLSGERLFARIYRKEEVYHGESLSRAPELILVPQEGAMAVGTTEFIDNKTVGWTYAGSGWHRMEGVFIAAGENICQAQGFVSNLQITDLFPIIVTALELPVPAGLDGRVPAGLFREKRTSDLVAQPRRGRDSQRPDAQWEEEIRRRLRNLGYV
ncbi:MAG: alkaline phosphatase family protein [Candidatus Bipolaricaulota bacterium]|nr:alkaline phosphatase family protein [Candidatus Bipolaricaulota bacterium]MDW8141264.1 alkaline phosphatase family protein [Candidatus Bipolaricaulota bacterium]